MKSKKCRSSNSENQAHKRKRPAIAGRFVLQLSFESLFFEIAWRAPFVGVNLRAACTLRAPGNENAALFERLFIALLHFWPSFQDFQKLNEPKAFPLPLQHGVISTGRAKSNGFRPRIHPCGEL